MEQKHIQFEEWQPGEPLDEEHLSACARCRAEMERAQFLYQMIESAAEPEIPPFFAKRVVRLAVQTGGSFWDVLDQMARRLTPALACLSLAASILLVTYRDTPEPLSETPIEILIAEEQSSEVTIEDMILVLALAEWEEESGDAQQY